MTLISEPVLVVYNSRKSRISGEFMKKWDLILLALKQVHPKLRICTIMTDDCRGLFDINILPKDIYRYTGWTPMIFLVPGKIWDQAMETLGPENRVVIKDGVQIFNGVWRSEKIEFEQKYDFQNPKEFVSWLKAALADKDFKRVQDS